MTSVAINKSLTEIYKFLFQNYSKDEIRIVSNELKQIVEHIPVYLLDEHMRISKDFSPQLMKKNP